MQTNQALKVCMITYTNFKKITVLDVVSKIEANAILLNAADLAFSKVNQMLIAEEKYDTQKLILYVIDQIVKQTKEYQYEFVKAKIQEKKSNLKCKYLVVKDAIQIDTVESPGIGGKLKTKVLECFKYFIIIYQVDQEKFPDCKMIDDLPPIEAYLTHEEPSIRQYVREIKNPSPISKKL